MNIAYIADRFSNHNIKWINSFVDQNNVIIICEESLAGNTKAPEISNVKVYPVLPKVYPLTNIWKRYKIIRKIKKILRENNTEILHSMYVVPYSIWGYHSKFKRHIVTTRGSDVLVDYSNTYSNPNGLRNKYIGFFMKKIFDRAIKGAMYVTSTSYGQQKIIANITKETGKLKLVRTGTYVQKFMKIGAKIQRNDSSTIIFSNRAMRPLYNISIIIDTFISLKNQNKVDNLKLLLCNYNTDKEYFGKIQNQIEKSNYKQDITVLNDIDMERLIQAYKNADIVVMIPSSDGLPVSGVEAMVLKKPLIVGNVAYDDDMYNDNTVWSLPEITPAALEEKINEILLLSEYDIKLKTEQAFNNAVELADTEKEMKKIEELYKDMLKKTL